MPGKHIDLSVGYVVGGVGGDGVRPALVQMVPVTAAGAGEFLIG